MSAGLLSLLAAPVPTGLGLPDTIGHRLLLMIQPTLLAIIGLAFGAALYVRCGLSTPIIDAALAGSLGRTGIATRVAPALIGGSVCAALLFLLTLLLREDTALSQSQIPLATRMLYGGLTEEVIVRWGIMSLCIWLALHVIERPLALAIGVSVAALLFALLHLPALYAAVEQPSALQLGAVLVGNTFAGLVYGWLCAAYGLEAAMAAHMLTHLIAAAARVVAAVLQS